MLFVVVAEFFVCWAPLHVLNTWYLFYPDVVYKYVGSTGVSLVQLLAYVSSCCNPITYCFMNRKFRQAFLGVFSCYRYDIKKKLHPVKYNRELCFVSEYAAAACALILTWRIYKPEVVCSVADSTKYYKTTQMYQETTLLCTWVGPALLVDPVSAF